MMDVEGDKDKRGERSYKCQRCLNHDRLISRKGHQCPYKNCTCSACDLNNLRSELMTILRAKGLQHLDIFSTRKSGRKQHCMLCSFHGERVELRGHKKMCPWSNCDCTLCTVGHRYRDTMAKQTKHRRSQRKPATVEEPLVSFAPKSPASSSNSTSKRVIMKRDWRRRIQASKTQEVQSRASQSARRPNPTVQCSGVTTSPESLTSKNMESKINEIDFAFDQSHPVAPVQIAESLAQRTLDNAKLTQIPVPNVLPNIFGADFAQMVNSTVALHPTAFLSAANLAMTARLSAQQSQELAVVANAINLVRHGSIPCVFPNLLPITSYQNPATSMAADCNLHNFLLKMEENGTRLDGILMSQALLMPHRRMTMWPNNGLSYF